METPVPHVPKTELPRVLNAWDGIAISVGIIIGSGIFMTAPGICAQFTSPLPVMLLWLFGAGLALLGGLTFAEIASSRPKTGGQYVYLLEAYGRPMGFVFGWNTLVLGPAGLGAMAVGFGTFFVQFYRLEWSVSYVAAGIIAFWTIVNIVGTKRASLAMIVFTGLKVAALVALIVAGALVGKFDGSNAAGLTTFAAKGGDIFVALGMAVFPVIWTYAGWDSITQVAGEVRDPQKLMPRIIVGSILVVTAVYLAANFLYIAALGVDAVGASRNAAGDTARAFGGEGFASIITFGILCSIFGAMNGSVLTGARIVYAMAHSGLTFEVLGAKSRRFETPVAALLWNGAAAIAFCLLLPDFFDLLRYNIFASTTFFTLSAASIFIFRSRGLETPFRTPGYPWVPGAFVAVCVALLVNAARTDFVGNMIVAGALLLGFPIYYVWNRLARSREPVPIP